MRVDDFDFDLPEERIALHPARPRDSARLLQVRPDSLTDRVVSDLPAILRAGDVLVLNDTAVMPAQLRGVRMARPEGGGDGQGVAIDVTLHKRDAGKHEEAWRAFVRPAKRLRVGDILTFSDGLTAEVTNREGAEASLVFSCAPEEFQVALQDAGVPPLPPYIARKREITAQDTDDYQTIYAREKGSVAAPTAGLHFTDELLARLKSKGIQFETVTLHVSAGTFLPVSADDTSDHVMHAEWGEITDEQAMRLCQAKEEGRRIIAVGTTSLRLLETAARRTGQIAPFKDETDIFITPGFQFQAIDGLLTNFHLPRSTLFMLVSALMGLDRMKSAYEHAIEKGYRFYSYGDASLLERIP
ncbi:MAG: tRNA preQ1(34) S-adenosylmethionine ribosyltransferase-isomerase QueA [Pseudomonadota bacterium]